MAIIKTVTNDYEFAEWVKQSDSYSNNFTFEGANALQAYFEEYSEETGENIEWDPIAWCVEFTEYDKAKNALKDMGIYKNENEDKALENLQDNTTVIEFDGGIIIADF